jgi:uncharacterized protein (UPF0335 family)
MKRLNMPVSGIQKIRAEKKKDADAIETARKELESAAALLGTTVFTSETVSIDDPFNDQDKGWAQEKVEELDEIDTQVESIGEDIKELLKEAKAEGFVAKLIPELAQIKANPEKYKERSGVLSTYLTALGLAV